MVDSQNRWLLNTSISILYKIGNFNGMKKNLKYFFSPTLETRVWGKNFKVFPFIPNQPILTRLRSPTYMIRHDQGLLLGFGILDSYQNHKIIFYYKYSFLCLVLKSLILMQFEYKRKYKIECELMYYIHYWFNI